MGVFLGVAGSLGRLRSLSTITVAVIVIRTTGIVLSIMIIVSDIALMPSCMIPDTSGTSRCVVTLYRFATLIRRLLLLLLLLLRLMLLISGMLPTSSTVRLAIVILRHSTIRMTSVTSTLIAGVARRLRFPTSAVGRVLAVTLRSCSSVATTVIVVVAIVSILLLALLMRVVVGRMRLIVFGLRTASSRVSFAVVITAAAATGCVWWTSSVSSGVVVIVRLLLVVPARRIRVLLLLRVLLAVTSVVRSWVGISIGKTARDVVFETLLVITFARTVVA